MEVESLYYFPKKLRNKAQESNGKIAVDGGSRVGKIRNKRRVVFEDFSSLNEYFINC